MQEMMKDVQHVRNDPSMFGGSGQVLILNANNNLFNMS